MTYLNLNGKGFTLLEVLVAILIVSLGLMAVAGLLTTSISANTFSRDGTIAIQLAEEMADRIRTNAGTTLEKYNGIDTGSACGGDYPPAVGDCNQWTLRLQNSGLIGARGRVWVTNDSPISKSALVIITVTWGVLSTPQRSVTFTTIMETWIT